MNPSPVSHLACPLEVMKSAITLTGSLLLGIVLLPVVLAGGDPPPPRICGQPAGSDDIVLATIRELESGGDYSAQAVGSTASGAYQFLDSSWSGYGGYTHAKDAPTDVQDAKAAENVSEILDANGNDVTAVPVVWYIGHVPGQDSTEWDLVPHPEAGNRLTPRQYQARWMTVYNRLLDETTVVGTAAGATVSTTIAKGSDCIAGGVIPLDGEWSLPGPRQLIDANPAVINKPHHDYPAWDWLIPEGTPIYAVRGGRVAVVRNWPYNWWNRGCGTNGADDCVSCGIGVTIHDEQGTHWTYCHGSAAFVQVGDTVRAGQQIMLSGNTGKSGTPHLHLEIRTDGVQRCPQPLLRSLYERAQGLDPKSLPVTGCNF